MDDFDKTNIKLLSILSYIGPLFIIGNFSVEKKNPEVKFHIFQGIRLFSSIFFIYLVCYLLYLFRNIVPDFLEILMLLLLVGSSVGWIVLIIIGVSNVINNKLIPLPFVGNIFKRRTTNE